MNDYFFIYNYKQALYFIKNGALLIDIDKGKKGDIYHLFPRDKKHEDLFMSWKIEKYGEKAI
jgi:hypothetical protein